MILDLLWRVKLDLPLLELLEFIRGCGTYRRFRSFQVEGILPRCKAGLFISISRQAVSCFLAWKNNVVRVNI